jgi:hypothetical protein
MSERYFTKFPIIKYANTNCIDITERVNISQTSRRNPFLFYPLEIKSGLRPDIIAASYYEDAEMDWLIYLSNIIVDPYYGWYLNELEFNDFINDKYGDIQEASRQTKWWRNNWATDLDEISVAFYNNNLDLHVKQYYSPSFMKDGKKIMAYRRKESDEVIHTNKIVAYDASLAASPAVNFAFSNGQHIIFSDDYIGNPVGNGEVVFCNTSYMIVQHLEGNTYANTTWVKWIYAANATPNAEVALSATTNTHMLYEVVTNAEARFWNRVTMYDWEVEQNEAKKHLYIMDKRYSRDSAEQLRKKLNQ